MLICTSCDRSLRSRPSLLQPRVTEANSSSLCRSESSLRPGCNHVSLMFGKGCKHVHHELVGMRVVDCNEIHLRLHQTAEKRHRPRKPVKLGYQKRRFLSATGKERRFKHRAINAATTFNLNKLFGKLKAR